MTRKSGCRRALAVAVLWCCVQLFAVAENIPSSIVSFDDSEVEVRKDGNFDYLSIDDFPALPLKVHEKDSKGFLLVDTKDGGTVLSLIHISEPTRQPSTSRMPSSA